MFLLTYLPSVWDQLNISDFFINLYLYHSICFLEISFQISGGFSVIEALCISAAWKYWHFLIVLWLVSRTRLCPPYPPHLKNVTTLPCKMHNFFVWLKVCYIPPNVGGSEKSRFCGLALVAQKKPVVMCGKWNVRQATLQQMFKVTTFCTDTCFQFFFATDQLHHPPGSAEIQPMLQQDARNSSISQIGSQYMWKNKKDEKFVHFRR